MNQNFTQISKKLSSRGGLECIGVRFSFSKFGTSVFGGSNPSRNSINRSGRKTVAIPIAERRPMAIIVKSRQLEAMIMEATFRGPEGNL